MSNLSALSVNDAYMKIRGSTARDRVIADAKRDFEQKLVDNPGYEGQVLRNGTSQRFLVTRSDVTYKCTVVAYPGEDLFPGDILEFGGEHWIMHQTRVTNAVQISGTAWLCNHLFRFQAFSPEIHERWGVLDTGVYSTTRTSDSTIMTLDMQYKIYLPYDDVTALIHEDQRFATDKWVDKNGSPILLAYAVTGRDRVSKSYGDGAHLLVLNARSSSYNAEKDNYDEMICDYRSAENNAPEASPAATLSIDGRNYMRIGSSRVYYLKAYFADGTEAPVDIDTTWKVSAPDGAFVSEETNKVSISLPDMKSIVGETIMVRAEDPAGQYAPCEFEIEVVL